MLRILIYTIVICIGATSGIQAQIADFGDAPDGEPTGYPSPFAAVGSFPSLLSSDGARTLDITQMTLGPEADLEEDAQTVNADADDGLRGLSLVLTSIPPSAHLEVEVSAGTGGVFFLNVLVDLNMDGQWPGWGAGGEYEWVVKNFPVTLSAGDSDTVVPPVFAFGNGNRMPDGAWMRVALTDSVINGSWDGSGEFAAGEIEDYVVRMPEKEGEMVSVVTANCPAPPLGDPIIIEQGDTVDFDAIVNVIPGPDNISYSFERLIGGVLIQDNNPGAAPGFKDAFQGVLLNQAGPGNRAGFTAKAAGVLPSTWRYRFWAEDPLTSVFDTHVIVGFPGVVEGNIEFVQKGWSMFETSVIGTPSCTVHGDGSYTIEDISLDFWGQQDSGFLYVAQITGDVTIEVKVDSLEFTDDWAKAGVMFRESSDPNSKNVAMVGTPWQIAQLQYRPNTNDWTWNEATDIYTIPCPYWVRLERNGNMFKGYYSVDGYNWNFLSEVFVDMPENSYAGIVATSHTEHSMGTFEFSNLKIQDLNGMITDFDERAICISIGPTVDGSYEYDHNSDNHILSNQSFDIWEIDNHTFVYTTLEGDGEVSARITGIDSTNPWAAGGVMIRETLDPRSSDVIMGGTGGDFRVFQQRKYSGGHPNFAYGYSGTATPPYYVKLVREGDTFTGLFSLDGSTWIQQCNSNLHPDIYAANPGTVLMNSVVYAGIFYNSKNPLHISKAYFDDVKVVSKDNDTAAHAVVIDNFMETIDFSHVNDGSSMPYNIGTSVVGYPFQVLGGERDIRGTLFKANPNEGLTIQCQDGSLQVQMDENANARVSMTWDGLDNDWLNDNVSQDEGLGTRIVRQDMNYTISIDVVENLSPVDVEISLFSDDTDWTKWYITLPVISDPCQISLRPEGAIFSGTGANPNRISAIKVDLGAGENVMQGPMDITINRLDIWNFLWPSDRFIILDYMGISPQEPVQLEIGGTKEGFIEGWIAPVKPDVDLREYAILNTDLTSGEEIVQQSLVADLDTQANAASVEDLDMLFPCGDGPVGFTICASSSPFSSGQYVLLVTKFVGDIPLQHGGQIYEYSVVFDSDGETWNNYIPDPAYSNDFFAYTDKWYELTYIPTDGWNLQVRDVRQNYAIVSSNARVVITGSEMAWLIPREELDSDTVGWRTTALVHTGDYGFTGGFWSSDYYPLVDDPLIPISEGDSIIVIEP